MPRGGKREEAGRPVGSKGPTKAPELKKDSRIVVACTLSEANALKEKAKAQGKTVSRFIIETILKT